MFNTTSRKKRKKETFGFNDSQDTVIVDSDSGIWTFSVSGLLKITNCLSSTCLQFQSSLSGLCAAQPENESDFSDIILINFHLTFSQCR